MTLISGGAQDVNDPAPTISGTTDVGTSGEVTVTLAGQTLTATPAVDGSWSVTPTMLANGIYTVRASTVDGAGNTSVATQQLTIDTVPPLITLDGAPSILTANPSVAISGTTDAATGTRVTVDVEAQTLSAVVDGTPIVESVGQQTLSAVVQPNGTWNVSPGVPMGQGARTVTASVTDPAGNTSVASEQLDVEAVAPTPTSTPSRGPTPTPTSPTPTLPGPTSPTPPMSPTPPASTPAAQAPQRVTVSSHTLTAQRSVTVSWFLARSGTVQLTLVERLHGDKKVIGTVIVKDHRAGKHSYTLTQRFAGHKLAAGSYTLRLQTMLGKHRSRTVAQKLTVR